MTYPMGFGRREQDRWKWRRLRGQMEPAVPTIPITVLPRAAYDRLVAIAEAARLVIDDITQFTQATLYVHSDAVKGESEPLNELDRRLLALSAALERETTADE